MTSGYKANHSFELAIQTLLIFSSFYNIGYCVTKQYSEDTQKASLSEQKFYFQDDGYTQGPFHPLSHNKTTLLWFGFGYFLQ